MKIFILRNAWKTTDFGGAEELAINLVLELNKPKTHVVLMTGTKSLLERARKANAPIIEGPYSKHQILTKHRFIYLPKYLFDLYIGYRSYLKIFSAEKPDLIHATGQQDSISATSAAKKLGIPIIWSDHGELKNSIGFKFMPPWSIPGFLLMKQLRKVSALCMVNPVDIEFVKSINKHIPIVRVPNGISDKFSSKKNKKFDLVFASRVIKEKGIFELLNSYIEIIKTRPQTNLLISGEGPSLDDVKLFIKNRNLANVAIEEYSDENIKNARIFVLPTYTEAQSLAILKAMMYQTPIVTTSIDGNTHFLKHNKDAILIPPKDVESLTKELLQVLDNKLSSEKFAITARKEFLQSYDLGKIVKKYYIPLYNSCSDKK